MKHQADAQRFIDFSHKLFVYPAHVILQSLFIDRPNLLQKDNRILDDSVPFCIDFHMCRSFALFILEVIRGTDNGRTVPVPDIILDDKNRTHTALLRTDYRT